MQTYRNRAQAERAINDAGLSQLPATFYTIAGRVTVKLTCCRLSDYNTVIDRGFDAELSELTH